jgi:hypothetical protein
MCVRIAIILGTLFAFMAARAFAQQGIKYKLIATSETIYLFDMQPCFRWIDGGPAILVRDVGYPDPKTYDYVVGYHYLYSFKYASGDSVLSWKFGFRDSLETTFFLIADFEGNGTAGIMGSAFKYLGNGTELVKLEYSGSSWEQSVRILPFNPGMFFTARIFDAARDGFIFTFSVDTTTVCDTCYYDNEYPPVGLVFCDWQKDDLKAYVDSTAHNWIQALAVVYGQPSYVYMVEELPGPTEEENYGALVKYEFDSANYKLKKLYETRELSFPYAIFSDHSSRLYVSDTMLTLVFNRTTQWFIDDGKSLTFYWLDRTPFDCEDASYFDIDGDGKNELICSEAVVKDKVSHEPNWRIMVYKVEQ